MFYKRKGKTRPNIKNKIRSTMINYTCKETRLPQGETLVVIDRDMYEILTFPATKYHIGEQDCMVNQER